MTEVKLLEDVLKKHLKINAARINFLANFIIAILKVRTVNLTQIAVAFSGKGQKESNYKRLQRFFRFFPSGSQHGCQVYSGTNTYQGLVDINHGQNKLEIWETKHQHSYFRHSL